MRMIMVAVETFNGAVRDGSAGAKMKRILDQLKPEAAYFTDRHGQRSAVLVVDLADASKILLLRVFLFVFNAGVEVHPVMLQDLAAAGLEGLGKRWT